MIWWPRILLNIWLSIWARYPHVGYLVISDACSILFHVNCVLYKLPNECVISLLKSYYCVGVDTFLKDPTLGINLQRLWRRFDKNKKRMKWTTYKWINQPCFLNTLNYDIVLRWRFLYTDRSLMRKRPFDTGHERF